MDGISGAASLITVLGFALSSTRAIYEVVSGIKNGGKFIQRMTVALQDLSKILQQITECTDRFFLAANLDETVTKCAEDLKALEKELAKLCTIGDSKVAKQWKTIKTLFKERDLERMSSLIRQHITALSLQMQVIEGKRGSSHTLSLDRIEALSSSHKALSESSINTITKTNATMDEIKDSVQALELTATSMQQRTLLALEQLGNSRQHIPGLSNEQYEALNDNCNAILEMLKNQPTTKTGKSSVGSSLHEGDDSRAMNMGAEQRGTAGKDNRLQDVLDQLRGLTEEEGKTLFCEESDAILHKLHVVLDLLLDVEKKDCQENRKGKRLRPSHEEDDAKDKLLYQREIKRIKGFISASQCVAINEKASRPPTVAAAKYRKQNLSYQRSSHSGTITLRASRKYRRVSPAAHDHKQDESKDMLEWLEAYLSFLPNNTQNPWFAVFRFIKRGNLDGLIQALTLRKASLTDRDLQGRCLLNHAVSEVQPDICKFLIEGGADVDFVELKQDSIMAMHSLNFCAPSCQNTGYCSSKIRCMTLLLETGADPTYKHDQSEPFAEVQLRFGTAESLKPLLNHSLPFIETCERISADRWVYHHLDSPCWTYESIALLLRKQEKGGLHKQNLTECLHYAALGSQFASQDDIRDALILLVRQGADIHGTDDIGFSVSQIACHKVTEWCDGSRFGEYQFRTNHDLRLKEIWMEVLHTCGYNAEEVISTNFQEEQYIDDDDYRTSDDCEESDATASDYSDGPICEFCADGGMQCRCDNEPILDQNTAGLPHPDDRALLGGDAKVWRS